MEDVQEAVLVSTDPLHKVDSAAAEYWSADKKNYYLAFFLFHSTHQESTKADWNKIKVPCLVVHIGLKDRKVHIAAWECTTRGSDTREENKYE